MTHIFDRHVAFEFLRQTALVTAVLVMLVFIVQFTEQATRSGNNDVGLGIALAISALRLSYAVTEVTFLSAFIGGLIALGRLTTNTEALALKSLGVSGWRIIIIGAITSAVIALFAGPLLSPLTALAIKQSNALEKQYYNSVSNIGLFSVPPKFEWGQLVAKIDGENVQIGFNPRQVDLASNSMLDVRFDFYRRNQTQASLADQQFYQWIQADKAVVGTGETILTGVTIVEPGLRPRMLDQYTLAIEPDLDPFVNSTPAPYEFNLLELVQSQSTLRAAGIQAPLYVLRIQQLLSYPLLAFSAVMLAAFFAMRSPRHGNRGLWVTLGYICGGNLFFLYNLTIALGTQSVTQAQVTVWILPVNLTLLAIWLLSFTEDG